jgi:hypothetical protein
MDTPTFDVLSLYKSGGWLLGTIGALFSVVQTFRAPHIQQALPPKWQWDYWPVWARVLVIFVTSLAGGVVTAIVGGATWTTAIIGGVLSALGAIGAHQTIKSLPPYKANDGVSLFAEIPNPSMPVVRVPPPPLTPEQRTQNRTLGVDDVGPLP